MFTKPISVMPYNVKDGWGVVYILRLTQSPKIRPIYSIHTSPKYPILNFYTIPHFHHYPLRTPVRQPPYKIRNIKFSDNLFQPIFTHKSPAKPYKIKLFTNSAHIPNNQAILRLQKSLSTPSSTLKILYKIRSFSSTVSLL